MVQNIRFTMKDEIEKLTITIDTLTKHLHSVRQSMYAHASNSIKKDRAILELRKVVSDAPAHGAILTDSFRDAWKAAMEKWKPHIEPTRQTPSISSAPSSGPVSDQS